MNGHLLSPAPEKLIDADGRPVFGNFAGAVQDLNLAAFDFTSLRRPPWTLTRSWARNLLKRWQFVGVVDDDLVFGAAVVHLNYLSSGFAYVYDRRTGKIIEGNIKSPLAANTRFSPSPVGGATEIHQGGQSIVFENTINRGRREVDVSFGTKLHAKFAYDEIGPGVTTSVRQVLYGFNMCYKSVALPAAGTVTVEGVERKLSPNALALLDWSAGTPPRETIWNWAAAAGRDATGRAVGLNFGCGLNEYSFHENTLWLDGGTQMVGGVSFAYDARNILGVPWRLTTADGEVDLTFRPDHERFEDVNFGLVASRLHQPFGHFVGSLAIRDEKLDVDLYGFCEEHYARW
jgi:hypothetical protein